jgi:crossover junction endodeoxyribonuclease RusA
MPLLLEFIVEGRPLSHQTENREKLHAWQDKIRAIAEAKWNQDPLDVPLELIVTFYHEGEDVLLDNDNMIKPIQDAMNEIVYTDDRRITDNQLRKSSIEGRFHVRRLSMVLLEGFSIGNEFIHVVIRDAPDHSHPLR